MTCTLCKMLARTNWALSYIFLRKKSIFDRPTIIRVQVWPSNSKTTCSWSCNFQNRLYLTIRLFWRVVLLKLTTPSSGATYHLLFLSSLSSFSPFLCSGALGLFFGGGDKLTCGPYCHVSFISAKPPFKTARWSNINGFDSLMVKHIRFWSCMAKIKLGR